MAPLISLTTDFGVQSQGVGLMEGVVFSIAPEAKVIHLMHGLPPFDIVAAGRTLETVRYLPVGHHVCVCDPGVGTPRRALACEVERGDRLIGPDNGVLLPAARVLGGIRVVREITNSAYMRHQVSPIFHGRDIFAPAAAHLHTGIPIEELGPAVPREDLVAAPYEEATVAGDRSLTVTAIQVNRFGSVHLNVLHEEWDRMALAPGDLVDVLLPDGSSVALPVARTFGDVEPSAALILKDDYGRVEIAKNLASFVEDHPVRVGDTLRLRPQS